MAGIRRWEDMTWQDFAQIDAQRCLTILPVAAIEQHGPHLPLGVDAKINRGTLARALTLLDTDHDVLVLPEMPVGKSDEHSAFPGTLSLSTETLCRLWFETGACVHRAGIRKLLILNSHGGQTTVARIVAQDLRVRLGMLAVVASTFAFGEPAGLFPSQESRHGIHAGANETSLMLHLAPDTVRTAQIDNFPPASIPLEASASLLRHHGGISIGWATQDLHPSGACGDASLASAQAGEAITQHIAARLAILIGEILAHPLDSLREGPLQRQD